MKLSEIDSETTLPKSNSLRLSELDDIHPQSSAPVVGEGGAAFGVYPSNLPKREQGFVSGVLSGATGMPGGPSIMQQTPAAKQYRKGQEIGEPLGIAADIGMTAYPLAKAGKALYGAGQTLAEKFALGKTSRQLAEDLRATSESKAGQIAKQTGQEMTAAEQRAAIAGKAEEKAQTGGELSLRPLAGVSTEMEAGRFKPVAQTLQDIGTRVKDSANKAMETLRARRNANAEVNKQAAFGDAFSKEAKGIQPIHKIDAKGNAVLDAKGKPVESDSYKAAEREIKSILKNPVTGLTDVPGSETEQVLKKFLSDINPRQVDPATGLVMGKPASFEGLETVRRRLSDRAYGFPETGFDAINQQQAKRLAELVGNIQKEFSPNFDKFLKQYAKDSKPLDVFKTKVGKALTDVQLPGSDFASVAAQDIPDRIFKRRENYNGLVEAFNGDRKLAEAEAKRYFASQLESKATALDVENFIRKNKAMLVETNSLKMAEKYAIDLRKYEQRATAAGGIKKSESEIAYKKQQLANDYRTFESNLSVAANDPAKITSAAHSLSKAMLEHGHINQAEYRALERQIEQVKQTTRDATALKKQFSLLAYRAAGYGIPGGIAGYATGRALTNE
jgi:hypothetical protein